MFQTGLGLEDLKKTLEAGAGGGDPEMLYLRDGDQVKVTFVSQVKEWVTFNQHYVGKQVGYRICGGDGCAFCDDGIFASKRTLIGVYVHELYQSARKDFKAKVTKNMGYRYFTCNKDTIESLAIKASRRAGKLDDFVYIIERRGDDTTTKYDIERDTDKTSPKILRGWKNMDIVGKLEQMFKKENSSSTKLKSSSKEDDDFDFDDDYDDDDLPKKKKSKKTSGLKKSSGSSTVSKKKRR